MEVMSCELWICKTHLVELFVLWFFQVIGNIIFFLYKITNSFILIIDFFPSFISTTVYVSHRFHIAAHSYPTTFKFSAYEIRYVYQWLFCCIELREVNKLKFWSQDSEPCIAGSPAQRLLQTCTFVPPLLQQSLIF